MKINILKILKILTRFERKSEYSKDQTLELLNKLKKQGKTVLGYGASTKGNTLLQYYGMIQI